VHHFKWIKNVLKPENRENNNYVNNIVLIYIMLNYNYIPNVEKSFNTGAGK